MWLTFNYFLDSLVKDCSSFALERSVSCKLLSQNQIYLNLPLIYSKVLLSKRLSVVSEKRIKLIPSLTFSIELQTRLSFLLKRTIFLSPQLSYAFDENTKLSPSRMLCKEINQVLSYISFVKDSHAQKRIRFRLMMPYSRI